MNDVGMNDVWQHRLPVNVRGAMNCSTTNSVMLKQCLHKYIFQYSLETNLFTIQVGITFEFLVFICYTVKNFTK